MKKTFLDEKFREAYKSEYEKFQKELEPILRKAEDALAEAKKLAEERGFPFQSNVSEINQTYYPRSFLDQYDLDNPFQYGTKESDDYETSLYDLGIDPERAGGGWEHSDVC